MKAFSVEQPQIFPHSLVTNLLLNIKFYLHDIELKNPVLAHWLPENRHELTMNLE